MQHNARRRCEHGIGFISQTFRHKIKSSTKPLKHYESRRTNFVSSCHMHVDLLTGVGTTADQMGLVEES